MILVLPELISRILQCSGAYVCILELEVKIFVGGQYCIILETLSACAVVCKCVSVISPCTIMLHTIILTIATTRIIGPYVCTDFNAIGEPAGDPEVPANF